MRNLSAMLVAMTVLVSAPTHGVVYKWEDGDGVEVHSGSRPPGQEAEEINPRFAKQPAGAAKQGAAEAPADTPGDGDAEPAAEELTPEQMVRKKQNCVSAQKNIEEMNYPRIYRRQYRLENGELAFFTPEVRGARLSEAQAMAEKYCN